jgi:thiamine kinase-like enzyme
VKNFYCRQKELLEELDQEVEVPWTFVNGDIPNNLRHTGDEVYLVDWELSGVGVPYIELIEFFTSGEISEEIQQTLMENYEQIYDLPKDWRENAGIIEKFHGFNSMIWAAKKKEQRNEKKYEEIFEKRMEHLENLYGE